MARPGTERPRRGLTQGGAHTCSASSTDDPSQSIHNTLDDASQEFSTFIPPDSDRFGTFWSSTGSDSMDADESLTYQLQGPVELHCVAVAIYRVRSPGRWGGLLPPGLPHEGASTDRGTRPPPAGQLPDRGAHLPRARHLHRGRTQP